MPEDKPLILATNAGTFAVKNLTPESISSICTSNGILVLSMHETCHLNQIEPPPGDTSEKVHFQYTSVAIAEAADRVYIPATAVLSFFYSIHIPPMSAFDEAVKVGVTKFRANKAGLTLVEKPGIIIPE